jgi:hypothetical protein
MSDVYSEQGRVEPISSGIDMLLDTPVSADELGATIDSVVRHSPALRS